MRAELERLLEALEYAGEDKSARRVSEAVNGSDTEFREFLTSNELWGGMGSIADQAGFSANGRRSDATRVVEAALIDLGHAQVATGIVNPRTSSWVSVFEEWRRSGI